VTVLYCLANLAYLFALPLSQIQNAPDDRVATAALSAILGSRGAVVMAVAIIISTFGCNNGLILAGSRRLRHGQRCALLSRDGEAQFARSPRHRTRLPRRLDYRVVAASHAQTGRHVRQPLQRSSKLCGLRRFDFLCADHRRHLRLAEESA